MTKRILVAFLLAACGLLAAASAASADDTRRSHRPISATEPGDGQLEQRLRPAQDLALLRALAKKLLNDPKQLNKLSDHKDRLRQLLEDRNVQDLLKDPKTAEMFRDALENPNLSREQLETLRKSVDQIPPDELEKLAKQVAENPRDFNLDQDQARELGRLAKTMREGQLPDKSKADLAKILKQMRENPNVQRAELDALQRSLPGLTPPRPMIPSGPLDPPPGMGDPPPVIPEPPTPPPQPGPGQPPPDPQGPPPETAANDAVADAIIKFADFVQDLDPDSKFLDSTGDLLRGLVTDDGSGRWGQGQDLLGSLGKLREWLPTDQVTGARSWLEQLNPPSVPSVSGSASAPSLPGGGAPSVDLGTSEGLARLVIWGMALAGLAFLAWKLAKMYREGAAGGLAGRWPVEPGAVATRGDLVRAFEYLALRLLGLDARHRHHLDLADRLGGPPEAAERRQAAGHLAHLYELARYAPEDEPLPEEEMAAARRDLSFLAGAAAA